MLEWFSSIGDFLVILIGMIVSFFRNVVELVVLVFKAYAYALGVLAFMPIQYRHVIIVLVSFSVIVAIIHFGG